MARLILARKSRSSRVSVAASGSSAAIRGPKKPEKLAYSVAEAAPLLGVSRRLLEGR